jgi:hypothetical protein
MTAAAGTLQGLDESLRWLQQLQTSPAADIGLESQSRLLSLSITISSPATQRQLRNASPRQVSNVATPLCRIASKLLLYVTETSPRDSSSVPDVPVAAQVVLHLLHALTNCLRTEPELAYLIYDAAGAVITHATC